MNQDMVLNINTAFFSEFNGDKRKQQGTLNRAHTYYLVDLYSDNGCR
ncbi:hypothetical protein ACPV4B_00025 [Vibrio parahaemolyticus]